MNTEIKSRPVITMTPVTSSQIAAIGHDPATNTLAVRFPATKSQPDGSLYHYSNFSAEQYAEFLAAESKGAYHGRVIKTDKERFPYERIS